MWWLGCKRKAGIDCFCLWAWGIREGLMEHWVSKVSMVPGGVGEDNMAEDTEGRPRCHH